MYVSEICAGGIFVTFPWWLKNVKSRSKVALFSNERHFKIWFQKKKTITFFWSKLSKLHKKRQNFACGNYISPKTRGNKNKPWTHSTPLNASAYTCWAIWDFGEKMHFWFKKMFLACFKAFKKISLSICIYNDFLVTISGDSFYCGLIF